MATKNLIDRFVASVETTTRVNFFDTKAAVRGARCAPKSATTAYSDRYCAGVVASLNDDVEAYTLLTELDPVANHCAARARNEQRDPFAVKVRRDASRPGLPHSRVP